MFDSNVRVRRLFEDMCNLIGRKPRVTTTLGFLSLTSEIARVMQVQPEWVLESVPDTYQCDNIDYSPVEVAILRQKIIGQLYELSGEPTYDNLMIIIYTLAQAYSVAK